MVIVDVPGYLPGVGQEWGGVVRRGAKLLHAFGEATVPRVTLVTRKIYGGAYIAMNSRSLGATKVFAWPDSEVAVMGAKAAVGILHKRKLAAAPEHEREALHEQLAAEHERIAGGVDSAIEIGVVDEKIDPAHTRSKLTHALAEPPPPLTEFENDPEHPTAPMRRAGRFAAFTPPFNMSGQPAISLPLHRNAEDVLIRVASQLESAHPWSSDHPAVP